MTDHGTPNGNGNGNGNGFAEIQIVHTSDENGQVHIFEKVDELEVDGQDYALLIYRGTDETKLELSDPDADEIDEEVMVMKILHEDGVEVYENIEDEAEFDKVVQHIEYLHDEEEDDEDDDGEHIEIELSELLHHLQDDDEESKN